MKEKKLLRALGNVDNQYIKEAEPMKKTSKITNRQKWVSVAACFVLVVVIGVGVFQSNLFGTKTILPRWMVEKQLLLLKMTYHNLQLT